MLPGFVVVVSTSQPGVLAYCNATDAHVCSCSLPSGSLGHTPCVVPCGSLLGFPKQGWAVACLRAPFELFAHCLVCPIKIDKETAPLQEGISNTVATTLPSHPQVALVSSLHMENEELSCAN